MDKSLQLGIPTKKIVSKMGHAFSLSFGKHIIQVGKDEKKHKNHHSNSNSVNMCHMVVDFYLEQCSSCLQSQ